jgi:hypothetical protein
MHAKFKTHLIGLAVGLGFVATGYGLGEPPIVASGNPALPTSLQAQAAAEPAAVAPRAARRGALQRHLGMPYVSFAALLPRQEP